MARKKIQDFEKALRDYMEELFGNCEDHDGAFRSMAENLGVSDTAAVVESVIDKGLRRDDGTYILYFHTTLARNIEGSAVPGILERINELNNAISVGFFPFFGHFAYFKELNQIFLSYRMPISPKSFEIGLENARYYLKSLKNTLGVFADYILFICDDPDNASFDGYLEYLKYLINTEHTEERFLWIRSRAEELQKQLEALETEQKE